MKLLIIFAISAVLLQYHFAATAPGHGGNGSGSKHHQEVHPAKPLHDQSNELSAATAPSQGGNGSGSKHHQEVHPAKPLHNQSTELDLLLAALNIRDLPKELNDYNITKKINDGAYGEVVLATHIKINEEVAIKIIDKNDIIEKMGNLTALENEVNIMKLLNHPNIVKLFHTVDTNDKLYLVMEYAAGGDMHDHYKKHKHFSEEQARAYYRQIVSSIEYSHEKKIAHRDIKLENFLLDDKENIKVADFGFSLIIKPGDAPLQDFCGTDIYMSPELIKGGYDAFANDAWGLGVFLYLLLTGVAPFNDDDPMKIYDIILTEEYDISPVPFGSRDLIKKILVKEPKKRPTAKAIMDDPWMNIGYGNNKLKPYVEPKLDQKHQDEIKTDLIRKGYEKDEIKAALEHRKYDDHVYAAYLILERKKMNPGLINAGGPRDAQAHESIHSGASTPHESADSVSVPIFSFTEA